MIIFFPKDLRQPVAFCRCSTLQHPEILVCGRAKSSKFKLGLWNNKYFSGRPFGPPQEKVLLFHNPNLNLLLLAQSIDQYNRGQGTQWTFVRLFRDLTICPFLRGIFHFCSHLNVCKNLDWSRVTWSPTGKPRWAAIG